MKTQNNTRIAFLDRKLQEINKQTDQLTKYQLGAVIPSLDENEESFEITAEALAMYQSEVIEELRMELIDVIKEFKNYIYEVEQLGNPNRQRQPLDELIKKTKVWLKKND